jgi:hypothetical protein
MPLGFERINERTQRPNAHINFIRTLPGSSSATAEGILNRVAAICYPFMKKHMILVQALEEFPYNNEFVGRNFNAGEVIQLVLRNKQGQWLPEQWVMMVMVHELAHCKQMNHSKAFWKVRDEYAKDLRELWQKGYTGEGLWGKGRGLASGELHHGSTAVGDVPEHLCGGTYGRRRRKRRRGGKNKEKEELSYAEKKQRRILKKFGAGGKALGADDETKVKLENGVAKKGKPRVAGSARGRDLRAAAALARFESVKKEEVVIKTEEESESESEDEYDEPGADDAATDVDGKKMVDDKGRALVKICEDEDNRDEDARREMEEIQGIERYFQPLSKSEIRAKGYKQSPSQTTQLKKGHSSRSKTSPEVIPLDETYERGPTPKSSNITSVLGPTPTTSGCECSVCSLVNAQASLTCAACSNVLDPHLVPDSWKCSKRPCRDSKYLNSGDVKFCGICGSEKDK